MYQLKELVFRSKLPLGATRNRTLEILKYVAMFTEHQWNYPTINDLKLIDEIFVLNNVTVVSAINELGITCSDFVVVCEFAGEKFPCFQEHPYMKFVESTSYLGACCSFNYYPDNDNAIPFATNFFGVNGGLSVIGTGKPQASDGKSGALYSEGFEIMIHHPMDFAVESAPTILIGLGKETHVTVSPIHSSCSDQVLALPFSQRKCIIPSDRNLKIYRQPACMLECLQDEVQKRCHCHPFHLPKKNFENNTVMRDCIMRDAICFAYNYCKYVHDSLDSVL